MRIFGETPDGEVVREIILRSESSECGIITYGAAVRFLKVPGRDGEAVDVVLGYDLLEDYLSRSGRFGAVMGRCANRISNASFVLNGERIEVTRNRGKHHIHGGARGFDKRVWDVSYVSESSVTLFLVSADGEEGYPGRMAVSVTYTLKGSCLRIDYLARCDSDTVCNLTNHSYFNLGGGGTVEDHIVSLACSRYTEQDGEGIPTGIILDVSGTCMDLRGGIRLGDVLADGGYDHNYISDSEHLAHVDCPSTGISMDVRSDMPAVQFYTGGGIAEGTPGKNGRTYGRFSGLCFEAQHSPDSPNRPEFPPVHLRAGDEFRRFTEYSFSVSDLS